ncbi:MAG: amidohydrolase family protein [Planctomycetota bacterium]
MNDTHPDIAELRGWLMLPDRQTPNSADPFGFPSVRLTPGVVILNGDRIAEVIEDPQALRDDADRHRVICPAFTDTHLHLPQFSVIGAHGLELLDWLERFVFPAESCWADTDFARAEARHVAQQLLRVGTVGVAAYATAHHDGTHAALDIFRDLNFRGVIGQVLMDRHAPPALTRPYAQQLEQAHALQNAWPNSGGDIAAAVTPRFAIACTPELLEGAGKLAAEHQAFVQTHLAETRRECDFIAELFGGPSYVSVYKQAGLLTGRTLFGHGIHLDAPQDADRAALRHADAIIAHCPTANDFLGAGAMPLAQHRAAYLNLTLGSDVGAGYERSMVRVARNMLLTAARLGPDIPNAAQAWWQITAGNAHALQPTRPDETHGVLRPGARADVLVIEPDLPDHAWMPKQNRTPAEGRDPLAALLWAWDDRWLKRTIAAGQTRFTKN